MKISTLHGFNSALSTMLAQQAKLVQTEQQIGTGLRLLAPSDDPEGAVRILNLEDNLATISQFGENGELAESQLNFEENVLGNVGNTLQRIRELTVQAANGTNNASSRAAIAAEISARQDELLALANSRDANGEYIFAGFNASSLPFTQDSAGNVTYHGDQGTRRLQVGEGVDVAVRDSGADVFLRIPGGNGQLEVEAAASNSGGLVVKQFGLDSGAAAGNYTVSFSQPTPTDPLTYTVEDDATPPNTVDSGNYSEGQALTFAGVQIALSGLPDHGDTIQVQPPGNSSLFESVNNLVTTLTDSTDSAAQTASLQNGLNRSLDALDQAIDHLANKRTTVGARLNMIDNQRQVNADLEIQLQSTLSDTRDLDYTEAISRFNAQLTSLQAAQQSYVKMQGLSLFQYL